MRFMNYRFLLFLVTICCAMLPTSTRAQSNGGVNSSYSRFGLGLPADQSQGFNRSMGGVGQGLRASYRINMLNPASYSACDSLTFLFDVGMSLQQTHMKQNGATKNINNTSFDYVNAAFRVLPNLGMSVGFVPYTNIGYDFTRTGEVTQDPYTLQSITQTLNFNGDGGLHQAYAGIGWQPLKGFSIGVNMGYLWGNINNTMSQTFYENGTANTSNYSYLYSSYTSAVKTWKGDIGVQYQTVLNPQNRLTLGATVGIGHTIGSEATILRTTQAGDTIQRSTKDAYQIPMTYSLGAAWEHKERLLVAADATLEQWGECTTPQLRNTESDIQYVAAKGELKNRVRINAGVEYVPGRYDRPYMHRINYRFGAFYSTPYMKVNGLDGPKEFGLTAGLGLPISNRNTRSKVLNIYTPPYLNIGIQWTHRNASSSTLIREDMLAIKVGITFNEAWFMKWKFR